MVNNVPREHDWNVVPLNGWPLGNTFALLLESRLGWNPYVVRPKFEVLRDNGGNIPLDILQVLPLGCDTCKLLNDAIRADALVLGGAERFAGRPKIGLSAIVLPKMSFMLLLALTGLFEDVGRHIHQIQFPMEALGS